MTCQRDGSSHQCNFPATPQAADSSHSTCLRIRRKQSDTVGAISKLISAKYARRNYELSSVRILKGPQGGCACRDGWRKYK